MQSKFRIARIVNTFGIRGELKIISETDFEEERFRSGNHLYIIHKEQEIEVTVDAVRPQKGCYIISFKEFTNINDVEHFKGGYLAIDPEQQQDLEEDAFYYHQIIGLNVETIEGRQLGTIKEILELGSNDVWVVKRIENGKKDALIPYIDDIVKSVDLENKLVMVELMEGLIDNED